MIEVGLNVVSALAILAEQPHDARDQRVLERHECRRKPGPDHAGLNACSLPGGIWTGSDGNVRFTDQGTIRAIGRIGTAAPGASIAPPSVAGAGQFGTAQQCSGDLWSTWAGEQPSLTAFGFDGYQWRLDGNAIAGQTGSSYLPSAADVGHQLSCTVTRTYALLRVTVSATSAPVTVFTAASLAQGRARADAGAARRSGQARRAQAE